MCIIIGTMKIQSIIMAAVGAFVGGYALIYLNKKGYI